MGDPDEEFEPLFDYRRVQPINFVSIDDDSDSSSTRSPKKRKVSSSKTVDAKARLGAEVVDCDENDEDDDVLLLPPIPMILGDLPKCNTEDYVLMELRKRKEELASLAKSAGDVLKPMYESEGGKVDPSLHSSSEKIGGKPSEPMLTSERAKIVLSIQDKAGQKQFRIYVDDKFERLFKMYSEKVKIGQQLLMFSFDGNKINPLSTPASLYMEDEDIIEVHVKSR